MTIEEHFDRVGQATGSIDYAMAHPEAYESVAAIRQHVEKLRRVVEQVDYFGDALIAAEFDRNSRTVAGLVMDARAVLADSEPNVPLLEQKPATPPLNPSNLSA